METAYLLFEGKYSMTEIQSMTYKNLISLIENENNNSKQLEEMKAAQRQKKELELLTGKQR